MVLQSLLFLLDFALAQYKILEIPAMGNVHTASSEGNKGWEEYKKQVLVYFYLCLPFAIKMPEETLLYML